MLAVLSLEDLQRVGIVEADFVEKPNATTIERMIDERIRTFQKSDARLRKRNPPIAQRFPQGWPSAPPMIGTQCTGVIVDEWNDLDFESVR